MNVSTLSMVSSMSSIGPAGITTAIAGLGRIIVENGTPHCACNAIGRHVSSEGRVAVTGCAGFIGINMVTPFLDEGREVLGFDCVTDNVYPSDGRRARLLAVRA